MNQGTAPSGSRRYADVSQKDMALSLMDIASKENSGCILRKLELVPRFSCDPGRLVSLTEEFRGEEKAHGFTERAVYLYRCVDTLADKDFSEAARNLLSEPQK